MNRIVIGITGPIGSGVSTTAKAFAKNGFKLLKVSDAIREEQQARKVTGNSTGIISSDSGSAKSKKRIPKADGQSKGKLDFDKGQNDRRAMQDLGNELRESEPAYWIDRILKAASVLNAEGQIADRATNLVIESIRNPREAEFLLNLFAPNFFLIAIQASWTTRWARIRTQYGGQENLFSRDDSRDTDEDLPHGQQVDRCVNQADYAYVNEKDKGASAKQLEGIWKELETDLKLMRFANQPYRSKSEDVRDASRDEVAMAVAYAQSHQSACLKRHVGAVIVDANGLPLSVGFNENPIGMEPCKIGLKHCFKDEEMHKTLENRANVKCPACGADHPKLESPWKCCKCQENLKLYFFPSRNMELCTAIHAEERAIRSLGDRSARDATIYTTTFPCFQCSRYIVDAGIKRVVYVEAYPVVQAVEFLKMNNVKLEPFNGFKARAFNLVFKPVN